MAEAARRIDPIFDKLERELEREIMPPRHVHVGAGKLGLSLIVPSLAASGDAFRIIDTPKDPSWAPVLAACGEIALEVNSDWVCALKVASTPAEVLAAGDAPCLVISDDEATLRAALRGATTLSCSLGPWMTPTMTRLVGLCATKPTLYCCENDHAAVEALKASLSIPVVDCMVDRVSTARVVDAAAATIRVSAEAWKGTIVSLDPEVNAKRSVPFAAAAGAAILAPTTPAAAAFLSDRKLVLVNGTHTTLAFLSLRARHALEPGALPLGKPNEFDAAELRAWSLARSAILLHDHGLATVKATLGADAGDDAAFASLTAYAAEALGRFDDAPPDTVARVLGGGVANRWHGRLESVVSGLDRARDHDAVVARFLDKQAAPSDLKAILEKLVAATRGAHDKDVELHHPEHRCHHEH